MSTLILKNLIFHPTVSLVLSFRQIILYVHIEIEIVQNLDVFSNSLT